MPKRETGAGVFSACCAEHNHDIENERQKTRERGGRKRRKRSRSRNVCVCSGGELYQAAADSQGRSASRGVLVVSKVDSRDPRPTGRESGWRRGASEPCKSAA